MDIDKAKQIALFVAAQPTSDTRDALEDPKLLKVFPGLTAETVAAASFLFARAPAVEAAAALLTFLATLYPKA